MSRYIDIEPLENALKAVEKRGEVAVLLDELISVIAKYPTADVQEVKHSRWEWDGEYFCSVCGYREPHREPPFCGGCGAKMF